ncbi:alpha/beta fold hydrolase [Algirhabdus cladophorae]|uniref:alpha/beta fold hydrolase n=1 Tax=Algirhabdus cladophorae TaxID=3377108 RepID=UPI003B8495D9
MWTIPPVSKAKDGTAYDLMGPEGAPLIVLIHGLGLCRQIWQPVLPEFAGFRVLNYDLYGHGESGPAPEEVSLSLYARQIAGLMEEVGVTKAHIVGFSIGGMINRRFALDFPDRVASLCILNSPHDRGPALQAQVEARAKTVLDQGAMATMDSALQRWFTPEYLVVGDGPDKVIAWRGHVHPESYAGAAWVLANGVVELTNPTAQITAPSLVMTCENDTGSTPAMSHAIAAQIPEAQTKIIPHLQHLGLMEDPQAFAVPIREFLESQTQ